MTWKHWLVGGAALVAFDALLIWGVREWRARSVPVPLPAPVASIETARAQSAGLAAPPMQTACMDGATWGYNAQAARWFKLEPALPCKVGDVREALERDGTVRRYPRSSATPHDLTQ